MTVPGRVIGRMDAAGGPNGAPVLSGGRTHRPAARPEALDLI